jgi:hypothetical protein
MSETIVGIKIPNSKIAKDLTARLQNARRVVLELHGVQIGLDVSLNISGMTVAIGS